MHAVNGKGAGPARRSNPVVPTAEVPDPPESVAAEALPDGTVKIVWPAANGQGNTIAKYAVTAASAGATAPVGESRKGELIVPAGELRVRHAVRVHRRLGQRQGRRLEGVAGQQHGRAVRGARRSRRHAGGHRRRARHAST